MVSKSRGKSTNASTRNKERSQQRQDNSEPRDARQVRQRAESLKLSPVAIMRTPSEATDYSSGPIAMACCTTGSTDLVSSPASTVSSSALYATNYFSEMEHRCGKSRPVPKPLRLR